MEFPGEDDMCRRLTAFVSMIFLCITVSAVQAAPSSPVVDERIPAAGITKIVFRDIEHTDFAYRGSADSSEFLIQLDARAGRDGGRNEETLSGISFETRIDGSTLEIRLVRPDPRSRFRRWMGRDDWRVGLEVSGPGRIDADIDASFSTVRTTGTSGVLDISGKFTDTDISGHDGALEIRSEFGDITVENLRGAFDIQTRFGNGRLGIAELKADSRASTDFGEVEILLPAGTGASFREYGSRSVIFGACKGFSRSGTDSLRLMNGGGPVVSLDSGMGSIRVREEDRRASAGMHAAVPDNSRPVRAHRDSCVSEPKFERGVIRTISVNGHRLCTREEIVEKLNFSVGDTVSRADLDAAMRRIEADRMVNRATYHVGSKGNLSISVQETGAFAHDWDIDAAFNRVGGLGLGPRLKITSPVALFSELEGYARYNWGPEDWSWGVRGHRDFFRSSPLRIGGGYRDDYGSDMDWAIPRNDADLNEFFLGYASQNYFRIEEGRAFVSQSWRERVTLGAEIFDARYSSADRTTEWSLFKRDMDKKPNAPLGMPSGWWITGVRYSLDVHETGYGRTFDARVEVERNFHNHANEYPLYTRVFARGDYSARYLSRHTLVLRVAGGYSPGTLPDQRSFRLGGLNTLRGFAPGSVPAGTAAFLTLDGGDRMFLVNADYFLGKTAPFVLFADAGGVWNTDDPITTEGIKRDIGAGIVLNDDTAPWKDGDMGIRVNCAVPVGNGEDHEPVWTVNFVLGY